MVTVCNSPWLAIVRPILDGAEMLLAAMAVTSAGRLAVEPIVSMCMAFRATLHLWVEDVR